MPSETTMVFEAANLLWAASIAYGIKNSIAALRAKEEFRVNLVGSPPKISIIIPMRNEEKNISKLLESLVGEDVFEILVVDDSSEDRSKEIVLSFFERLPTLKLIEESGKREGWSGKNSACYSGYLASSGDVLLFLDADVKTKRGAISKIAGFFADQQYGFLSISPSQDIVSFGERVLLPGLFISVVKTNNFDAVNDPAAVDTALANGQIMAFRREVYQRLGTHEAVCGEVCEDVAFAGLVKKEGIRGLFFYDEGEIASVRMYRGFFEAFGGFSKNLFEIVGKGSAGRLFLFCADSVFVPFMAFFVPLYLFLGEGYSLFSLLLGGAISAFWWVSSCVALFKMRVPQLFLPGVPFGILVGAYLALYSLYLKKRNKREWKGRLY